MFSRRDDTWTEYKGQIWLSSFIRVLKEKTEPIGYTQTYIRWSFIEIDSHSYRDQELSCQPSPSLTTRKSGGKVQSDSDNLRIRDIWIETKRTRSVNIWGLEKMGVCTCVWVCMSVWIILGLQCYYYIHYLNLDHPNRISLHNLSFDFYSYFEILLFIIFLPTFLVKLYFQFPEHI